MPIEIIREEIPIAQLAERARSSFGDLVKAVVDVERSIMAIGGELHADEEAALLELGSRQMALWGINLYPDAYPEDDWIEFDSMINIRPGQGNPSRTVEDEATQAAIVALLQGLVAG